MIDSPFDHYIPSYQIPAKVFPDENAMLCVVDFPLNSQIRVPRVFTIETIEKTIRGNHAHKSCWQIIFSVANCVKIKSNLNSQLSDFVLSPSSGALVVPPMNWITLEFSTNSRILVATDQYFDESDYIRDYGEYLSYFIKKS